MGEVVKKERNWCGGGGGGGGGGDARNFSWCCLHVYSSYMYRQVLYWLIGCCVVPFAFLWSWWCGCWLLGHPLNCYYFLPVQYNIWYWIGIKLLGKSRGKSRGNIGKFRSGTVSDN